MLRLTTGVRPRPGDRLRGRWLSPALELDERGGNNGWAAAAGDAEQVSPRREPDKVRILSGVYEGRTTGTPMR